MSAPKDPLDIALLRDRLKYAFGKLRYTIDLKKQHPHSADEAKSTLRLALEQLKGRRSDSEAQDSTKLTEGVK